MLQLYSLLNIFFLLISFIFGIFVLFLGCFLRMIVFLSLVFPDEAVEILLFINLCVIISLTADCLKR